MGPHKFVGIATRNPLQVPGHDEMGTRLIKPATVTRDLGDISVGLTRLGKSSPDLHHGADPDALALGFRHLGVMDPAIDPIDHQMDAVGHFVGGKPFADHPANHDGSWICSPMDGVVANTPF